jgi:hypothetical protein
MTPDVSIGNARAPDRGQVEIYMDGDPTEMEVMPLQDVDERQGISPLLSWFALASPGVKSLSGCV